MKDEPQQDEVDHLPKQRKKKGKRIEIEQPAKRQKTSDDTGKTQMLMKVN